jgi:hypothetical protein
VYEARPLYWQFGVTPAEMDNRTSGDFSETPITAHINYFAIIMQCFKSMPVFIQC